ncbi:protein rep [Pseudonocardia halophobica]|uniref:protein rep n=1 Tax=Pseudonocardia halophobica TaxID=29401 RepID=UPI003D922AB3
MLRVSATTGGRRAGVAGLQSCGSVWACPVCARRIAARRSADLQVVLDAVAEQGGGAALLTLTMRHHRGHDLKVLWDALSAAWGAVTSGRGWTADRERFGVLGWVRTVEATHGPNGWHLHVHALIMFDTPVSVELAGELAGRMFGRWARALGRRDLDAVADRGGLDVQVVRMAGESVRATADYLSKITLEVTSPSTKVSRDGNRSPFAILRDALADGLADDVELWWSWEQASHGRRQLTWSRDLRAWAGLHREATDEEIVSEDLHGDDVLALEPQSWPLVRAEVADLLDALETGGVPAAARWLDSRGARWHRPGGVPPTPPPPRQRAVLRFGLRTGL